MAIMAVRENLSFESSIESDCAPLADIVQALLNENIEIHCLRDLTRGGLASALNEISDQSKLSIEIDEFKIPIKEDVSSACEMLGLDPLYVANEGKFVAFVDEKDADRAIAIMKQQKFAEESSIIGKVTSDVDNQVFLRSKIGSTRIVSMLSGQQLPRIC